MITSSLSRVLILLVLARSDGDTGRAEVNERALVPWAVVADTHVRQLVEIGDRVSPKERSIAAASGT